MKCALLDTLWLESNLFRRHIVGMFGKENTYRTAASTSLHVHHIFGGKTRLDLPSNTITICAAVHDFCHTHETEGRIACLIWKASAGHLDWAELNQAAGYDAFETIQFAEVGIPFRGWKFDLKHHYADNRPATVP